MHIPPIKLGQIEDGLYYELERTNWKEKMDCACTDQYYHLIITIRFSETIILLSVNLIEVIPPCNSIVWRGNSIKR